MVRRMGPVTGKGARARWTDVRLLIGVALVAIAVVGTARVVASADRTEPMFAARDTLAPGTVIGESDVVVVHVRVGDGYIPADEPAPWGMVVTRTIGEGELIPVGALVDAASYRSRPVAVTTSQHLGDDIAPGSIVDVWITREGVAGPESVLVADGLVVDQVERAEGAFASSADETVYVMVPARDVGEFLAALAGDGDVTVVGIAGA